MYLLHLKVTPKYLEEKTQVDTCTVKFFPSMFNENKRNKQNQEWNQVDPMENASVLMLTSRNPKSSCQAHFIEHQQPTDQTVNEHCSEIRRQNVAHNTNFNGVPANSNGEPKEEETKTTKCQDKSPPTSFGMKHGYKGGNNTECICIKRLKHLYTRIGLGSKTNAEEDITGKCLQLPFDDDLKTMAAPKRPPPGLDTRL